MELSSQELRQVEFGSELRGYKTSEVDDFLERVAVVIDGAVAEIASLKERLGRAERVSSERSGIDDEESIRRTLVLAQRTADLAIKEAQEEAGQLLDSARADAESIVTEAKTAAKRIEGDAEKNLREEAGRLRTETDRLRGEIEALGGLLGAERSRLTESLQTMLRFVEKNLTPPEVPTRERPLPEREEPDELEAAIAEDAAAAAPQLSGYEPHEEEDAGDLSRPTLMALPSLDSFGSTGPDRERIPGFGAGPGGAPVS